MKKEAFFIEYELGFEDGTITASVRNDNAEARPDLTSAVLEKRRRSTEQRFPLL